MLSSLAFRANSKQTIVMSLLISCLLPTFNSERYLAEALQSLLQQTYQNIEILILDDGSKDRTLEIARSFGDARVKIHQPPSRLGLAKCLTWGASLAQGEYLARMDADDISHPERFKRQASFLQTHPDCGLVASDVWIFSGKLKQGYRPIPPPQTHAQLRWELTRNCSIYHPTVMMRKTVFEAAGGYRDEMPASEDYDLWLRLLGLTKLAILDEPLVFYRRHQDNVSALKYETMCSLASQSLAQHLSKRLQHEIPNLVAKHLLYPQLLLTSDVLQPTLTVFKETLAEALKACGGNCQDLHFIQTSAFLSWLRLRHHAKRIQHADRNAITPLLLPGINPLILPFNLLIFSLKYFWRRAGLFAPQANSGRSQQLHPPAS
jgi:hypothetical protein